MEKFTLTNFSGWTEAGAASTGSTLSTGDLRRQYNFGSQMLSSLNIPQDPFFRIVSMLRTRPTDDPEFKFAEERPSFHKRYAYVTGHSTDNVTYTTNDATVTATNIAQGDVWYVQMKTDYKNTGNITNRYGQSNGAFSVGGTATQPKFFLAGLLIKIPFGSAYNVPNDYIVGRIEEVYDDAANEAVKLKLVIVRALKTSTNNELQWSSATAVMSTVYDVGIAGDSLANLESKRCYIVGSSHLRGSGYPETWGDQPYSTGYGQTSIFKTAFGMDNTTRATVLKYSPNEWARLWGLKMIDHKWDIENALLFSTMYTDADGYRYTQGIVDYVLNYGNVFTLTHASKTSDDFLNDMANYIDPRYNNAAATLWLCDTYTYNWLNKLSGFFMNNLNTSPNLKSELQFQGQSNILGVEVNRIWTIYGTMNVVRNVHLDGTGVHILGVNMNHVAYRPLVGNGINRDTTVYPGVQTIENSGVDGRVDLIQTEAGLQVDMPEVHAVWAR